MTGNFATADLPSDPLDPTQMYLMPGSSPARVRVNHLNRSPYRSYFLLDGAWKLRLDPDDEGITKQWYEEDTPFPDTIAVPGPLETATLDHHQGHTFPTEYVGRFWYRRDVVLPESWAHRTISLNIGGAWPQASVWINGVHVASRYCDLTPFRYDVSNLLKPGQSNSIVIAIDNRSEATRSRRTDANFRPFSGLWRSVELEAVDPVHVDDIQIHGDVNTSCANVTVHIANPVGQSENLRVQCLAQRLPQRTPAGQATADLSLTNTDQTHANLVLDVPDAQLWSPAAPNLYELTTTLYRDNQPIDSWTERFAMRSLAVHNDRLLLNNQPLYVRGAMHQFDFPATLSPPVDRETWRTRIQQFKAMGFNYLRLVGSVAPEELADVADEQGILLSSAVSDGGCRPPDGMTEEAGRSYADALLKTWWREHVLQLRNHPSVFLFVLGNESTPAQRPELPALYDAVKHESPGNFVVNVDGPNPANVPATLELYRETDFWIPATWLPTLEQQQRKPFLIHEYVNIPTLPDPGLSTTTATTLNSPWINNWAQWIADHQLTEQYDRFLQASYQLQRDCVKLSFEVIRAEPQCDGYLACAERDAESITYAGFTNWAGQPKALAVPEIAQWQADTLLLCDLMSPCNRTYYAGEPVEVTFTLSHHGPHELRDASLQWRLSSDDGTLLDHGTLPDIHAVPYRVQSLGSARFVLPPYSSARKLIFHASLRDQTITVENAWPLWAFPADQWAAQPQRQVITDMVLPDHLLKRYPFISANKTITHPQQTLLITDSIAKHQELLKQGITLLVIQPTELPSLPGQFWPGWWIPHWSNQGAVVEQHASINPFPHQGYVDMLFQALIGGPHEQHGRITHSAQSARVEQGYADIFHSQAFELDQLPFHATPLVHGITWDGVGTFDEPKHIAYLFEAAIEHGRALVTAFDLFGPRPEQSWMFDCLLRYSMR
jgi:hypothetical protein